MEVGPLSYYFGTEDDAINRLIKQYGDRLERMTAAQKLLIVALIAESLYRLEANPDDMSLFAWGYSAYTRDIDAQLLECLKAIDSTCEPTTLSTLIMVFGTHVAIDGI